MIETIGLTGKARSGKSTVADILRHARGFRVISFADTLRDMALAIDPVIPWPFPVSRSGSYLKLDHGTLLHLTDVVDQLGWEKAKDGFPEVRRFLQKLGTEGVRNHLGRDAWVEAWRRKVDETDGPVVAADVRFANEAAAVREYGEVWLIERPGEHDPSGAAGHVSERGIPEHLVNRTIVNDGTVEDLAAKVDQLMSAVTQ